MGMFSAELFEDSFQIQGMAEEGILPSFLATKTRFNTPFNAICVSLVIIFGLISFDFSAILAIDNFLTCLNGILELLACI